MTETLYMCIKVCCISKWCSLPLQSECNKLLVDQDGFADKSLLCLLADNNIAPILT